MSRQPFKRGLLVYGAGVVISLVTILVMPSTRVVYGVLTLLGSSMILMIPFSVIGRKMNACLGAILSFSLFLFTYPVNRGYFGFGTQKIIELPKTLYANTFTTYLGFTEKGFFSTDYFSILPWFFLFMTGYFMYRIAFRKGQGRMGVMSVLEKSVCPPLGWIGKRALIIYMLHQPVIYVTLYVWNRIF